LELRLVNNKIKWAAVTTIIDYLKCRGYEPTIDVGPYEMKGYCCGRKTHDYKEEIILRCNV